MRLFLIGVVYAACTLGCEDTPDATELVERATSRPRLRVFARQTCSSSQLPGQLQDATDVLGITFSHELGAVRDYLDGLANDLGGVAIGDLDGDHFPDLYFANTNGPVEVYMTAGRGALQWSASSLPWSGKNVTFADIDGDEVLDAVLAESWARNRGDGTFDAPIALPVTPDVLWLGFSAGDIDGDGDLDLFGSGHASTTGDGLPARSGLFENLGGATFATRSELLGERRVEGSTFIVSLVDLNWDGLPELYETNDAVSLADIDVDSSDNFRPGNRLFLNEGGWKLTDISLESGTDSVLSAMGIAIGDYNRDGHTDFYVTSMLPEPNILLAGQGSLRWQEGQVEAQAQSLYDEHDVGWGAVFVDLNADG